MEHELTSWKHSMHHDGSSLYVRPTDSGPIEIGSEIELRLRIHSSAPIQRVLLRTTPDGEQELKEMLPVERSTICQWWAIRVRLTMPLLHYRFLLFTNEGIFWLNSRGLLSSNPTDYEDFKILAGFETPSWVQDSVFYQIFPDRFADGDPNNNVREGEFVYRGEPARIRSWNEPASNQGIPDLVTFYGGDLEGIRQHLDYLHDLGVNALYLNPIFTSYSNHRYDVVDYFHVDPHLGGDEALVALRETTQALGMRIILDIVPNHCGVSHRWFQDALGSQESDSSDFFTFERHPEEYACWLGVKTLPKLNYQSTRLREVMYAGEDSVFRYWLKPPFCMDGWRIDVANMLARQGVNQQGIEVGAGIRQAVKETNPDGYLLGENFFDATHQLQGDFLDASMNYAGFCRPIWFWLDRYVAWPRGSSEELVSPVPWSTQAFIETLNSFQAPLPWKIAAQQFNLLDSHDTARILTILGGNFEAMKLAVGLLFTYPGVPCVYYGDEIGLSGDSHHNRGTMPWEQQQWNMDLRAHYQKLIRLRRTSTALKDGGFQWLTVTQDGFSYLRDSADEWLIFWASRNPATETNTAIEVAVGGIPDGTVFTEFFSNQTTTVINGKLPSKLQAQNYAIWMATRLTQ